jgi:hypothetical protein
MVGDDDPARHGHPRWVSTPILLGGEEVSRGGIVGVATGTPGAFTVSRLVGRADQAMGASSNKITTSQVSTDSGEPHYLGFPLSTKVPHRAYYSGLS